MTLWGEQVEPGGGSSRPAQFSKIHDFNCPANHHPDPSKKYPYSEYIGALLFTHDLLSSANILRLSLDSASDPDSPFLISDARLSHSKMAV
ncbi:hypothetical protein N7490_000847 [Penicillium lividum]|nr:hypothetical protein N7490_000847 [Penicillium lividum]